MEYIQTILFQIPAARLEQAAEAGGLLPELDAHRAFLKQQPGFRDLRITRSINNEGNILIVVETRWSNDDSLVRYETNEPNAAGIVRGHERILVRDSLQVLDMEALRTESSWAPQEAAESAHARVMLPLLIPLGALAFALLVVYGLSRVYLELSKGAATGLAAGIAVGILVMAFYLANRPRVPGWQIAGIFLVVAATLAGGAIWAVVQDSGGATSEASVSASPTGSPAATTAPGGGGAVTLNLGDNFFEFNGQKSPTVTVPAGKEVTIDLTNKGVATHNMHVGSTSNSYDVPFCDKGKGTACSVPNIIGPGQTGKITFTLQPGTYDFRCDFHLQDMTGKLEVK
jgi:plastocyanin/heme-degrading monooxygenase HmoA